MNRLVWTSVLVTAALVLAPSRAHAALTLKIDDTKSLTVGVGLRLSGSVAAADDGVGGPLGFARPEFTPESALLGFTGQLNPAMKLQLNLGIQPTGEFRVVDAIAMFDVFGRAQIWAGRMIPPIDRASLTGPLFASTWDLPYVGVRGGIFGGREDGFTAFGDLVPGHLTLRAGVYRGAMGEKYPANGPLVAARLTANLLDPEPGYYHSGTTYAARNVLSFGVGGRYEAGSDDGNRLPLSTMEADAYFEKKITDEGGAVTAEAGVYRHGQGTLDPTFNSAFGFYAQAGYLFPGKVGPGAVQLIGRFQDLDALGSTHIRTREDLTLNYAVQGHPLRFAFVVLRENADSLTRYGVRLGAQFIL